MHAARAPAVCRFPAHYPLHSAQQRRTQRQQQRSSTRVISGAALSPACAGAMANEQPPTLARPAVLLFGDSLTERCMDPDGGWGAALAHHFARKVDVVNRGFGGYNTRWALPVLEQVLAQIAASKQPILFATVWLGANDAALPDRSAARQHVPVGEYAANLEAIAARMAAAGIERIVLITPPPVYEPGRVRHLQERMGTTDAVAPDRTTAFAAQYAAAVRDLGARIGAPVLDLHAALQAEPGWGTALLCDGLHFAPAGQRRVAALLLALLGEAYPRELALGAMRNHFPWWDKYADAGPDKWESDVWQPFLASSSSQQQQQQQQQP